MSLIRPDETTDQAEARLRQAYENSAAAAGLKRLEELRSLRDSLRGTRFERDVNAYVEERGGKGTIAKLDRADRDARAAEQTEREETAANLAAARVAAAADLHTAATTKHVSQMSDAEIHEFALLRQPPPCLRASIKSCRRA